MTIQCTRQEKELIIRMNERYPDDCLIVSPYCQDEDMNCKRCLENNITWVIEEVTDRVTKKVIKQIKHF